MGNVIEQIVHINITELRLKPVINTRLIGNASTEISAILHMSKKFVNISRKITVIKDSIALIGTYIKVVRILIWDFVCGAASVTSSIFQEDCVGITCMDFVKKVVNV